MGHRQMLRVSKDLRAHVSSVSDISRVTQISSGGPQAGGRASALHLLMIPPGMRGTPHVYVGQETALFMVSGLAEVWHGAGLARRCTVRAGDVLYLPPGTPHLAVNRADSTSIAVVARTEPADHTGDYSNPIELPRHLAGLRGLPVAERV
jgi:uncharacterized RmlC-like cupin family protein